MPRHLRISLCALALALTSASTLCAEDKPAKPAAITIGEMRVQTMPAVNYLHTAAETTFANMGAPVVAAFDKIFFTASEAKLMIARPTMLVYQGGPHYAPDKPFKMEIGVIVADDAKVADLPEELKMRKTAPFKCATILYTGSVDQQGQAYQKLIPAIKAADLEPTGEEREMCLYWEGVESANNVFIMQIGVK